MTMPQWERKEQAREEAARRLEEQGIYGATTQYIEQEAAELLAQWESGSANDSDGAAR